MTSRHDGGTESQGFALEALYQFCPELESCDGAAVTLTLRQLETVLRAVGWKPPGEQQTKPVASSNG